MVDFQTKFDDYIDREFKEISKKLPLDINNKFSKLYWTGIIKGCDHYSHNCCDDEELTIKERKKIEDKINNNPSGSPVWYYWKGYLRSFNFHHKLFLKFKKHEESKNNS